MSAMSRILIHPELTAKTINTSEGKLTFDAQGKAEVSEETYAAMLTVPAFAKCNESNIAEEKSKDNTAPEEPGLPALKEEATGLGIKFAKNIGEKKLAELIDAAKAEAEKSKE